MPAIETVAFEFYKVCGGVGLTEEGAGRYRVRASSADGGDFPPIVLHGEETGGWYLSDEGRTLAGLFDRETRVLPERLIYAFTLAEAASIELRGTEFVLPIRDGRYGESLLCFAEALLQIAESFGGSPRQPKGLPGDPCESRSLRAVDASTRVTCGRCGTSTAGPGPFWSGSTIFEVQICGECVRQFRRCDHCGALRPRSLFWWHSDDAGAVVRAVCWRCAAQYALCTVCRTPVHRDDLADSPRPRHCECEGEESCPG
ncbi:MAG TPA: hypothetical protein DEQ28_08770 [Clostridiales bacterium]|nr:hypothetical protein [Clostridiales bacterium]